MPDSPKTESEAGASVSTDEELIARVSRGDAMAFETLVNRYQNSAWRRRGNPASPKIFRPVRTNQYREQ